jgi:hypothetical protein
MGNPIGLADLARPPQKSGFPPREIDLKQSFDDFHFEGNISG